MQVSPIHEDKLIAIPSANCRMNRIKVRLVRHVWQIVLLNALHANASIWEDLVLPDSEHVFRWMVSDYLRVIGR